MEKLLDTYNSDRNKTGRVHVRGVPLAKADYHLVVNIWIINSSKEILLTK
jgi:hypothetical protein